MGLIISRFGLITLLAGVLLLNGTHPQDAIRAQMADHSSAGCRENHASRDCPSDVGIAQRLSAESVSKLEVLTPIRPEEVLQARAHQA